MVSSVDHRLGFSAVEKRPEVSAERMPGASPPPTSRLRYCSGGGSARPGAGRAAASTTDSSPAAVRSRSGLVALTPSRLKRRKPARSRSTYGFGFAVKGHRAYNLPNPFPPRSPRKGGHPLQCTGAGLVSPEVTPRVPRLYKERKAEPGRLDPELEGGLCSQLARRSIWRLESTRHTADIQINKQIKNK